MTSSVKRINGMITATPLTTLPHNTRNGGKFKLERERLVVVKNESVSEDGQNVRGKERHGHGVSEILDLAGLVWAQDDAHNWQWHGNGEVLFCPSFQNLFLPSSRRCMGRDADAPMPSNACSSLLCPSQHGLAGAEDSRKVRKWKKQAKMQKYLRPGALAQLRDTRINNTRAYCSAVGRKRILVMDFDGPPKINTTTAEEDHLPPRNKMLSTPKTPKTALERPQHLEVDSRLESLPIDLLVRILCLLHHDELKSVFHVSQRIRKVAVMARQCYFNYTTPDRSRQEMLKLTARRLDEQWPLLGGAGNDGVMPYPTTPKAPRHNQRPPIRLSEAEMRQISASLFQGSSSTSHRKKPKASGLHRLAFRSQPSSRVLFYEEELCQAVAQNTLR